MKLITIKKGCWIEADDIGVIITLDTSEKRKMLIEHAKESGRYYDLSDKKNPKTLLISKSGPVYGLDITSETLRRRWLFSDDE